jgi:U3 small nucleolar ribonucleoprotein protein IMP4
LRREYIYRKSLEEKERVIYERKQKIKEAIQSGKPIPAELRKDSEDLMKELAFDDSNTSKRRRFI